MLQKKMLSLLLFCLLLGCTSSEMHRVKAKADFRRGNYPESINHLTDALKEDKSDTASYFLLNKYYNLAVKNSIQEIKEEKIVDDEFKWSRIYDIYNSLALINLSIRSLPKSIYDKIEKDLGYNLRYTYSDEISEAKEKAANEHYNAGIVLLESLNRDDAREAYTHFKKSLEYIDNYKDANNLSKKAKEKATRKIVFFPMSGGKEVFSVNVLDIITDDITKAIVSDVYASKYATVIAKDDFNNLILTHNIFLNEFLTSVLNSDFLEKANTAIKIDIEDIKYKAPEQTSSAFAREKTVTLGTIKTAQGSNDYIEQTITTNYSASLTIYTKKSELTLSLSYEIINLETSAIEKNGSFEITEESEVRWATLDGDIEALSAEETKLVSTEEDDCYSASVLLKTASQKAGEALSVEINDFLR